MLTVSILMVTTISIKLTRIMTQCILHILYHIYDIGAQKLFNRLDLHHPYYSHATTGSSGTVLSFAAA